jgi:hypothetical protein
MMKLTRVAFELLNALLGNRLYGDSWMRKEFTFEVHRVIFEGHQGLTHFNGWSEALKDSERVGIRNQVSLLERILRIVQVA